MSIIDFVSSFLPGQQNYHNRAKGFTLPPVFQNDTADVSNQIQAVDLSSVLGRNAGKFNSTLTSQEA